MIDVTCLRQGFGRQAGQGNVIYKTGGNRLGRFPEAASEDLLAGPKRNFQVFDPLDFLAEVTQHIPEPGEHLIRYYGWYSNKKRGLRAKAQTEGAAVKGNGESILGADRKTARKRWAALIKQVYETDPLLCPKCGGQMKIISFIERHQSEVIPLRQGYGGTGRKDSQTLRIGGGGIGSSPTRRRDSRLKHIQGGDEPGRPHGLKKNVWGA